MATTKSLEIKNVSNKQSKSSSKKNTLSKIKEIAYTTVIYAELILMCLIVLFPVVWIVGSSFNQGTSLAAATPIPSNPTIVHYIELFEQTNFAKWYLNTFKSQLLICVSLSSYQQQWDISSQDFVLKGKRLP